MPVPNGNERTIKIHRGSNNDSIYTPTWPPQQQQQPTSLQGSSNNLNQQETRTWSSQTVTKRSSSSSQEPIVTNSTTTRSSDLFSNAHNNDQRRGSSTPIVTSPPPSVYNTTSTNRSTNMKSSSLVKNALQEFEDGTFGKEPRNSVSPVPDPFANIEQEFNQNLNSTSSTSRRNSKTTTYTSTSNIPASTPSMEIVPSSNGGESNPNWMMGTDAGGDVPVTYEIVTKADGTKEFQLLLTAKNFSPEDLQVKLTDNHLYISGKHEERSPNGAFSQKSFYRSCTIPHGVRPEDLNCSLDSCGRLKITAPVPDQEKNRHLTTKTITTTQQHKDWNEGGVVPSGFKISPGQKEQVMSVWNSNDTQDNNGGTNNSSNMTRKEERTTTKTVRTYKTVS